MRRGEDTISVSGNVERLLNRLVPNFRAWYQRVLSIVPLIVVVDCSTGGRFRTEACPQFESEGHLRWDSLESFWHWARRLIIWVEYSTTVQQVYETSTRPLLFLDSNRSPHVASMKLTIAAAIFT